MNEINAGNIPGLELELALLAGLMALVLLGPGQAAVDRVIGLERDQVATVSGGQACSPTLFVFSAVGRSTLAFARSQPSTVSAP